MAKCVSHRIFLLVAVLRGPQTIADGFDGFWRLMAMKWTHKLALGDLSIIRMSSSIRISRKCAEDSSLIGAKMFRARPEFETRDAADF